MKGSTKGTCLEKKGHTSAERDMVGARPSDKAPHIDYEKQSFKHPSKGVMKMAAGGAAKVRHGAATMAGKATKGK